MSMYVDSSLIVDIAYLICAHKVEGEGPADGRYAICTVLSIGEKVKHEFADYNSKAERDAAFVALGDFIRTHAPEDETTDIPVEVQGEGQDDGAA